MNEPDAAPVSSGKSEVSVTAPAACSSTRTVSGEGRRVGAAAGPDLEPGVARGRVVGDLDVESTSTGLPGATNALPIVAPPPVNRAVQPSGTPVVDSSTSAAASVRSVSVNFAVSPGSATIDGKGVVTVVSAAAASGRGGAGDEAEEPRRRAARTARRDRPGCPETRTDMA